MTLDCAIAQAIHNDYDIVEACPEIHAMDISLVESFVERAVVTLHEQLKDALVSFGSDLRKESPGSLAVLIQDVVDCPPIMLFKMLGTILDMLEIDGKYVMDFIDEDGFDVSLYSVHITVDCHEENIQLQKTIRNRKGGGKIGAAISKMSVWDSISL